MSNDEAEAVSPPEIVREINAVPDPILKAIVHTVARSEGFEIGLTLHVSGVVISGTVVSGSRFFEEIAELLTREGHEDFT
jgi:hypothetical protein